MEHTNNDNDNTNRIEDLAADIVAQAEAEVRHQMRLAAHAVGADAEIAHLRAQTALDQLLSMRSEEIAILRVINTRLAQRLAAAEGTAVMRTPKAVQRGSGVADFDATPPPAPAPFVLRAVEGFDSGRVA